MRFSQAMSKAASIVGQFTGRYIYPAETSRHLATLLGFPSRHSISSAYYDNACTDIANLASAISAFEPVRLYSRPEDLPRAQSMVNQAIPKYTGNTSNISFIPFPTNHLWVRDTGPVYVLGTGDARSRRFAINFRFREWGKRDEMESQERAADEQDWPIMTTAQLDENATFARRVIETDVSPSPVTLVESRVCLEGGALVVDGEGTLLATESSIINDNRNAGLSRSEIEAELQRLLGVEKIIWFPGRKGLDITDVHADAEVGFIRPGVVVLSRPHASVPRAWLDVYEEIREILTRSVDAKGRPFEIHTVDEPDPALLGDLSYDEPATNYVNFYFVNGGLILPQFGDEVTDKAAVETFQKLCPGRVIQPVYVHALPLAGGVIHCATQPVIAVPQD
ncbi:hypothetical protein CNMCM8812_002672 [Aspergillus fumigatus]|nr:hypothetical protein CNMCM8812_002672 [Aspergillus fumigatus]KAH1434175.1 hypothetical protein KXX32_000668 [Aspergillus fumigatus]KAH1464678.1 hypothetical protein KXX13_003981 [Aspergillus fumigatus]KAH2079589.1 hypothetical protein KXW32_007279 [Aspergillus fumigatus]KAH2464207.1 hypothetical protein KXW63_007084 [Aspergillus fumigatus]